MPASNPILRGFNPDPSVIRVGHDYYIATSTFEWFPGVQIHHSKDLVNWKLISRPLNRVSQLDLANVPDSCGVWAPCLSYNKGTFYLTFSNVRSFEKLKGNTPNFLVTSENISGPWSDPIFLSNEGFDGSLFHDANGRKWFVSMKIHPEAGKIFGGIVIQEYDPKSERLTGPIHKIFEQTELGLTEGPHLYQRNGYYYLMLAEGGTEYGHAVTLTRSKHLLGPYEVHPDNPIITSREHPDHPLQKAGHGDLVETPHGRVYCTYLVGRPLSRHGRCTLGRETAISEMEWREDDWLYARHSKLPPIELKTGTVESAHPEKSPYRITFDTETLDLCFQSLRRPIDEDWLSLQANPGKLRLFGQDSLTSQDKQSLITRRVQAFHIKAETRLTFNPENDQQSAGLVCYYNTQHWIYAYVSNFEGQSALSVKVCNKTHISQVLERPIILTADTVTISLRFNQDSIQFYYLSNKQWNTLGPAVDGSILSDDYVRNEQVKYMPAFTGAMVGICCQDISGRKTYADFDYFDYQELNEL